MTDTPRGRPKGSLNKVTNLAKQAIQMAFDELGGVKRLVEWVREDKKNEFVFYTRVYPMLLPRPAPEPPPEPPPARIVQGALVWRRPEPSTDPAFPASTERPLSAQKAAEMVEAAVAGGLELPSAEALASPPEARAAGPP